MSDTNSPIPRRSRTRRLHPDPTDTELLRLLSKAEALCQAIRSEEDDW